MINRTRRKRNTRKSTDYQKAPILPLGLLDDYPCWLAIPTANGKRTMKQVGGSTRLADGTLIFHKTIHEEHFLKWPRAIGYSQVVVDFLRMNRFNLLLVRHAYTGTEYRTTLEHFLRYAFVQQRDVDVQFFLTLEHWTIGHPVLEVQTPVVTPQLGLFEAEVAA